MKETEQVVKLFGAQRRESRLKTGLPQIDGLNSDKNIYSGLFHTNHAEPQVLVCYTFTSSIFENPVAKKLLASLPAVLSHI